MELKIAYDDKSLEFFQELSNVINQKYNNITIIGYNENVKKERKHAFGLKSNYGTKLTPLVVVFNPNPIKAFYTDVKECRIDNIITYIDEIILIQNNNCDENTSN